MRQSNGPNTSTNLGWIKGRCDACLQEANTWGIGAVFRDSSGMTMASATDE